MNKCTTITTIKSLKKCSGLTLIEVLVALAILAIGLTALLQHTASSIHLSRRVDETLIKHWVAMQAITAIQSGLIPITVGQNSTHTTQMLGQTWYWQVHAQTTFLKTMEQMTITVSDQKTGPFTDPLTGFRHV